MNRTIKFRAWKNGKMYHNIGIHPYICIDHTSSDVDDVTYIDPKKTADGHLTLWSSDDNIMQYTGLTDLNGVEIYEGDWVKINSLYIAKVVFGLYEIGKDDWGIPHVTMGFAIEYQKVGGHIGLNLMDSYEVIGNVHQHPDLL